MEWWRGAVLYQVYPRSFMDGNGDGVGDIPGLISRLDHIASLGVDGIWLSPVFASPMKDFGYDVADYCDIDPLFGTLKDFDQLVAECHARGLKLIIDQVYSHTSDQHAWFKESQEIFSNLAYALNAQRHTDALARAETVGKHWNTRVLDCLKQHSRAIAFDDPAENLCHFQMGIHALLDAFELTCLVQMLNELAQILEGHRVPFVWLEPYRKINWQS